jgi:hypothetical protein
MAVSQKQFHGRGADAIALHGCPSTECNQLFHVVPLVGSACRLQLVLKRPNRTGHLTHLLQPAHPPWNLHPCCACCGSLFKKCQVAWAEVSPAKASHVPLALLQAALAEQGVEQDLDEVQCILANLIVRGYIKGYIAHKPKLVVLSKSDPFPPPSEKWLRDVV